MSALLRLVAVCVAAALLSACHLNLFEHFKHVAEVNCHKPQEYHRAAQVAPLKVPPGLDTPNTQGALVIPNVDLAPPPPGPNEPCLDVPPKYKPAPPPKGLSG